MSLIPNGTFEIECNNCHKKHLFQANDSDFQENDRTEGKMGPKIPYNWEHEFTCDCENIISIDYSFVEYPENTLEDTDPDGNGFSVINEFQFESNDNG
ncbi:MAG: hypothetical protein NT007_06880 [Candidatus Kapabacteria bacterium]|nr:hypothetical protein [Candidatus Kapabacteria bacterium]